MHIIRAENAAPEHYSFLADGAADPRREFLGRLREAIGGSGSIVAYNAPFERGVLEECCGLASEYRPWFRSLESRLIDLYEPFKAFGYYHPRQNGSASMKAVLPALTGSGYDHLEIQDGGTASLEFLRTIHGPVSPEERLRVRRQLESYCSLDTSGMIAILEALSRLCGQAPISVCD